MRLGRIPRSGDLPDVYIFECQACGVSHIDAVVTNGGSGEIVITTVHSVQMLQRKIAISRGSAADCSEYRQSALAIALPREQIA